MLKKDERCIAFGLAVRRYRKAKKLSQEELAGKTGIHRTYIGGIERGERNPTLIMIRRISGALNISPSRLFDPEPAEAGKSK